MTNTQLFLAIGVPSLIAVFNTGVLITLLLHFTNKLDGRMDRITLTLDAVRQDIADIKAGQRGHAVEIQNLKERVK